MIRVRYALISLPSVSTRWCIAWAPRLCDVGGGTFCGHRLSFEYERTTAHLTKGYLNLRDIKNAIRSALSLCTSITHGASGSGGPRAPKTSPREPQNTIKSIFRSQTLIFRKPSSRHHKIKVFEGRRVSLRAQNRHQEARREGK